MFLNEATARQNEQNNEESWQETTKEEKKEEPKWPLHAKDARFYREESGELFLEFKGKRKSVHLKPCFPWTDPRRYISVRDKEDKEVLYIDSIAEIDGDSRDAVKAALAESSYVMHIKKILELREDFELRVWRVIIADNTERSFQTKLDEWPFSVPGGGLLIRDVGGDLYFVAKPNHLDQESREQFSAFLD